MQALKEAHVFTAEELVLLSKVLKGSTFKVESLGEAVLSIGIKKLFMLAEMAVQVMFCVFIYAFMHLNLW